VGKLGPDINSFPQKLELYDGNCLHTHPLLEKKLNLSRSDTDFHKHVIVDKKDQEEGQEAIEIVRNLLSDKQRLPILIGLDSLLDKKISEKLKQ